MDTTHANELDRSILVKWANPHAVRMLLMHSLIKEVSFSWLAFQGANHVTIGLKVSAIHWCSISPPPPMGNGLSGGISSFNPGLLCGSRRDKARAGLACVVTVGWLVLFGGRGGCGAFSLSVVCSAGVLLSSSLSSIGVPLEGLRIGCGVTGVPSFLRNLRFRKVILPDPSTLIRYWLWGRVSMIWPVVFHRLLFVHWIDTICPFKSGRSVWAVRLYFSMSRALRWDRLFSRFRAAVIHSACGLYNVGWDGTKSHSRRWSNNWAGDKPMFWMGVFRYCRTALAALSLSKDPWGPVFPIIILLAVLTASSARPFDWG